jgi:CRP/FNR family transcriptional regulator, nitrogen fixation regulation protein
MLTRSTNTTAPVITIHANFGASEVSFRCGQEIHGQGEPAERVYEIQQGAVRSYKILSDGRRQICAFHLKHDIFGWEHGPHYRFTAEAIVDTTVRVVRRQTLEGVAAVDVQVTHNLLNLATRSLEHAENQMMLLGRKNSREKVAAFLLEMDSRLSASGVLDLPMSRRDIADYLGLTIETVSRELSRLCACGVLLFSEASQRRVVLVDRKKLQKLTFDSPPLPN